MIWRILAARLLESLVHFLCDGQASGPPSAERIRSRADYSKSTVAVILKRNEQVLLQEPCHSFEVKNDNDHLKAIMSRFMNAMLTYMF